MVNINSGQVLQFFSKIKKSNAIAIINNITTNIEDIIPEDNDYERIIINSDMRKKIIEKLNSIGSQGNIISQVILSESTAIGLIKNMNLAGATSSEINIVLDVINGDDKEVDDKEVDDKEVDDKEVDDKEVDKEIVGRSAATIVESTLTAFDIALSMSEIILSLKNNKQPDIDAYIESIKSAYEAINKSTAEVKEAYESFPEETENMFRTIYKEVFEPMLTTLRPITNPTVNKKKGRAANKYYRNSNAQTFFSYRQAAAEAAPGGAAGTGGAAAGGAAGTGGAAAAAEAAAVAAAAEAAAAAGVGLVGSVAAAAALETWQEKASRLLSTITMKITALETYAESYINNQGNTYTLVGIIERFEEFSKLLEEYYKHISTDKDNNNNNIASIVAKIGIASVKLSSGIYKNISDDTIFATVNNNKLIIGENTYDMSADLGNSYINIKKNTFYKAIKSKEDDDTFVFFNNNFEYTNAVLKFVPISDDVYNLNIAKGNTAIYFDFFPKNPSAFAYTSSDGERYLNINNNKLFKYDGLTGSYIIINEQDNGDDDNKHTLTFIKNKNGNYDFYTELFFNPISIDNIVSTGVAKLSIGTSLPIGSYENENNNNNNNNNNFKIISSINKDAISEISYNDIIYKYDVSNTNYANNAVLNKLFFYKLDSTSYFLNIDDDENDDENDGSIWNLPSAQLSPGEYSMTMTSFPNGTSAWGNDSLTIRVNNDENNVNTLIIEGENYGWTYTYNIDKKIYMDGPFTLFFSEIGENSTFNVIDEENNTGTIKLLS